MSVGVESGSESIEMDGKHRLKQLLDRIKEGCVEVEEEIEEVESLEKKNDEVNVNHEKEEQIEEKDVEELERALQNVVDAVKELKDLKSKIWNNSVLYFFADRSLAFHGSLNPEKIEKLTTKAESVIDGNLTAEKMKEAGEKAVELSEEAEDIENKLKESYNLLDDVHGDAVKLAKAERNSQFVKAEGEEIQDVGVKMKKVMKLLEDLKEDLQLVAKIEENSAEGFY